MIKNRLKSISILLIWSILLTSCKGVKIASAVTTSMQEYSKEKSMILVAEEKNKYENRYGHDIWKLKSGDGLQNFSDLIVFNVKKYIESIITINLMGDKYNVIINNEDMDKIDQLSNEYFDLLSDGDKNFMGCDISDVKELYKDFHKARLTIDHVTKNANIELSISESKVIKVQYIQFDDYDTAYMVSTKSQARGANFAYFAKQYTKANGNIERIAMRGDDFSKPFPEIFYLGTGQMSEILKYEDKWYLFKCIDDYMIDETNQRKEDILKQLKENAFYKEYDKFALENPVKLKSDFWQEINISEGGDSTTDRFYDMYYTYFPK